MPVQACVCCPWSREQVVVAFKRHEAAKCSAVHHPSAPHPCTSATTVLKGKLSLRYCIRMQSQRGAQQQRVNPEICHSSPNPRLWVKINSELEIRGMGGGHSAKWGKRQLVMDYSNNLDVFKAVGQRTDPRVLQEWEPLALVFENAWGALGTWENVQWVSLWEIRCVCEVGGGGREMDGANETNRSHFEIG